MAKALELAERLAQNAPMSNFAVMHALSESTPEAQIRLRDFLEGRAGKVVKSS